MKVRISIRGQTYTIRSDDDDVDLEEVASYVDARIGEVASSHSILDDYTVVMLAALNIASDFRRYRQEMESELASVERELSGIALLVESGVPGLEGE